MNNDKKKIEELFRKISYKDMSVEEQESVWRGIMRKQSSILTILTFKKTMIPLIITLVLALGVGGAAVSADNARPGDALFKLDQKIENLRLGWSAEGKKDALRLKFAGERVKELGDIKNESKSDHVSGNKVENMSEEDKESVSLGISAAITLLSGVSSSLDAESRAELQAITDQLNDYLDELPEDAKVKVRVDEDNNRARVDIKSEDGRIKVDLKNGEIKIKLGDNKSDSDDDSDEEENEDEDEDKDDDKEDSDDKDKDEDEDSDDENDRGGLEIEAEVFTNQTVVKVETNDTEKIYTTNLKTKAELSAFIKTKYPLLSLAEIESALEIEIEDRTSEQKDLD